MARSSRGLRGRERLNETQEASIESLEWWGMGEGLSGLGSVVSSSVEWESGSSPGRDSNEIDTFI